MFVAAAVVVTNVKHLTFFDVFNFFFNVVITKKLVAYKYNAK